VGRSGELRRVRGRRSEVGAQRSELGKSVDAEDLDVYKKAYKFAMRIFELSRSFPLEERFALTGQIRRSSRSVCLNLREAWAKRRYEAHFVSKLTDCDGENSETQSSLDFAKDCGYITADF
jgi:four helix bundle protein